MIVDEFFSDPHYTRQLINSVEMRDEKYDDGVTYPNIARLPDAVENEILRNMKFVVGHGFSPVLQFARYSFKGVTPPHWAHSDRNISQYLALIYLNDNKEAGKFGTVTLKHKQFGMEHHPTTDLLKDVLITHANKKDEWLVTFECPGTFNRCLILNADLIHASRGEFGSTKDDGRLVVSVFFNLEYP